MVHDAVIAFLGWLQFRQPTPETGILEGELVVPQTTSERRGPSGVRHISFPYEVNAELLERQALPQDLHVVVPAKDVEGTIAETVMYLHKSGLPADRVHVIVNNTEDNTADVAAETGWCTVYQQDRIFAKHPAPISKLDEQYGIGEDRLRGKGTAMFASLFVLEELGLSEEAPILFLDADIENLFDVAVLERLLEGWWQGEQPAITKLASLGRNNEGIHAFLGMPGNPYVHLGSLMWPLCGQIIVPWGVLREVRLASHYAVEIAMLMHIWEVFQDMGVFCEVEIGVPLLDERNDDRTHAIMYQKIMAFMAPFLNSKLTLSGLLPADIARINKESLHAGFWIPGKPGEDKRPGPNTWETRRLDAILPSLASLVD